VTAVKTRADNGDLKSSFMCGNVRQSPIAKARFPFKRINRLRCVRCVNENHKKRKRLRWQAADHGCHCFDRAFIIIGWRLSLLREIVRK